MQTFMWLFGFIALSWGLLYFRAPLLIGTCAIAIALLAWGFTTSVSLLVQVPLWLLFLSTSIPLNLTSIRRKLVSDKALRFFQIIMPKMSQTEKDALEAGSVWWDGELFSGKPHWRALLNTPQPQLNNEEQAFIDGPAQQLCDMLDDWKITHEFNDLPAEVWQFIKDKGFFGMIIPKRYGGLEFSALAHSSVVMKISSRSITAAVTVMVPNSLGPAELILRYGTTEQKEQYLPRLATGKDVPCFALTSSEAGSDAASMVDTGVVCRGEFDGEKDVLGIRLNWEKRYITLGPVATVLGLAFKLYDPEHLIGDTQELGITCALIPTDTPGVEIGARHFPLNSAFMNGPNSGTDVFIPIDWIIGGVSQAGNGWRMLMECLAAGRSISLPALSAGAGKLASRGTGAYARVRRQFKTPIGRFEGVQEKLAVIAAGSYTMDAARTLTTSAIDMGEHPSVVSAIVKYNMTELMRTTINAAMDVQGGSGICLGPRNLLGRAYQSIPISITVEGANILTRSLIIFGQGAVRCHPYVLKEITAAQEQDQTTASKQFDKALFAHIGFTLSNASRSLLLGLTNSRFVRAPVSGPTAQYYRKLTRMSSAFAFISDVAMLVLGGGLKRKEMLSGRLADVLSHMYLTSAVLKRFEDDAQPYTDLPLVQWSCENSLRAMQQALDRFINNFPNRMTAWTLRRLVFPFGKTYSGPSDRLSRKVADLITQSGESRDRLTHGIHLPEIQHNPNDALAILEYALHCVIAAEPAERKIRTAQRDGKLSSTNYDQQISEAIEKGIISNKDADLISTANNARSKAIAVDDFSNEILAQQKNPQPMAQECA